jgi:hypothetical protein
MHKIKWLKSNGQWVLLKTNRSEKFEFDF